MSEQEVSRITFRPPPFWFIQVESSFHVSGITTNVTKFYSVVSALDSDVLQYVADIIKTPPTDDSYEILKKRIISHFAETETARLRALFQEISLGDKRPSQLLHEMQNLASGQMTDEGIRALWLQRLPVNMQQILSVSMETLEGLAKVADKIAEVSGLSAIASVSSGNARTPDGCENSINVLKNQVTALTLSVNRLSRQRNRSKDRSKDRFNRGRSNSRSRFSFNRRKPICWYHRRFKASAMKCTKPCY